MKILKGIVVIILLLIIVFFVACSSIKDPRFLSVDKIELLGESSDEFILNSDISMFNSNRFEISTEDVSFDLYIDTSYIGNGKVENNIVLPKNDTGKISTILNIQKKLFDTFNDLKDSVSLNVLGSTKIPYSSRKYYFDFDFKIYMYEFINFVSKF